MIVAYAQAADRQGLNAAVNGQLVTADEAGFTEFRRRAIPLNVGSIVRRIGDIEVRYGKGLIRLEARDADSGAANFSPIVVVADAAEVLHDRKDAVRRATESIVAIGRQCDVQVIEAALAVGERLHRSARTRRRVGTAVATALVAATIIWLARGCATSEDMVSAASTWSVR